MWVCVPGPFMCVWGVVLSPLNNTHIDQAGLKSLDSMSRGEFEFLL